MRLVLSAFIVLLMASAASAQVIYLPVQYQYGHDQPYYYGGSDPYIFASAERTSALLRFSGVRAQPVRVYSDLFPYHNAALFGFTPTDARNEAYLRQPRYFRKSDLLEQGVRMNGTLYVPPAPPSREVAPLHVAPVITAPKPADRKRGVIIIIPKKAPEPAAPSKPVVFVSAS